MAVTARFHSLPTALMAIAGLMVVVETVYFASHKPGYSHVANTISELGEMDAPQAQLVAFGFFLPVGLLVWLALWLVHRRASNKHALVILLAMSCLGSAYAMSAFFPCDSGAPICGTWRTLVHNVLGFIEYEGAGIGFLLIAHNLWTRKATVPAFVFLLAGVVVLICLALLAYEQLFYLRGAIQRVAEGVLFIGVPASFSFLPGRPDNGPTAIGS